MLVCSLPLKGKESWLMTNLTLVPHMLALLMMSLIQTAHHKMASRVFATLRPDTIVQNNFFFNII